MLFLAVTTLVKIAIMLSVVLLCVSYTVYFERKVAALIQDRIGPNRVGWKGLLQPFADVLKLVLKEDIVPAAATKSFHSLAPLISLTVAMSTLAVIPFADSITFMGEKVALGIAPGVNIGILYVLALSSLGVYGITLSGWSSNNKYSLIGGIRSSAQMISYELSLGLSIIGVIMISGSLRLDEIVAMQATRSYWILPAWNVFAQPVAFVIFITAMFAETNRTPFDLPEAEAELVGGYHTEYSGLKFGMFFLSEYANMITAGALVTVLFLGGWHLGFVEHLFEPGSIGMVIAQLGIFFAKVVALIFFYLWIRWSLPRFRYDQLMSLGWKVLLPIAIANVVVTGAVMLAVQ
jgi:NADH-quinone oxidoreductase subunit H